MRPLAPANRCWLQPPAIVAASSRSHGLAIESEALISVLLRCRAVSGAASEPHRNGTQDPIEIALGHARQEAPAFGDLTLRALRQGKSPSGPRLRDGASCCSM